MNRKPVQGVICPAVPSNTGLVVELQGCKKIALQDGCLRTGQQADKQLFERLLIKT